MTNDEIKSVFLANGFTIKPGCDDLKPYVYEAARALIERIEAPYHLAKDDRDRLLVALRDLYEAQPYSDPKGYEAAISEADKVLSMFSA